MSHQERSRLRRQLEQRLAELPTLELRKVRLASAQTNDETERVRTDMEMDVTVQAINADWSTAIGVKAALDVIETGDYGTCEECGEPISQRRLEAIPWATRCTGCQQAAEEAPTGPWARAQVRTVGLWTAA